MEKNVIVVKTPRPEQEKYILLVARGGGGMFGTPGGNQTAFFVDGLDYITVGGPTSPVVIAVQAYRVVNGEKETVAEFVYGVPYTLMPRKRVRFISHGEAAAEQKAEEDVVAKVYQPAPPATTEAPAGVPLSTGQYA